MKDFYESDTHSELEYIVKRSISELSKAFSLISPDDRVVRLCSILDMIILTDDTVGIKESLKKYIPIFLSNDKEKRKELQDVISSMYDARSRYIHHGKRGESSNNDMIRYNGIVYETICFLIGVRTKYKSIKEIQDLIDDKMLSVEL